MHDYPSDEDLSPGDPFEPPCHAGPAWRARLALGPRIPPYLVLLRVGFTLPPPLLPARCALTAPFHPCRDWPSGMSPSGRRSAPNHGTLGAPGPSHLGTREKPSPAVCFLWHLPSTGLEARVPDVIRHTALRSSDFPLPASSLAQAPAATARPSCQPSVYREIRDSWSSCQPSACARAVASRREARE